LQTRLPRPIIRGVNKPARAALLLCSALLLCAVAPSVVLGDLVERPRPPPSENRGPGCRGGITQAQARPLIVRYYQTQGEWAGQYIIRNIERTRFVRLAPDRVQAHVRYLYHCILDRCGGLDDGYDQRVFHMECRNDRWRVTRMDGYMSAELP
jgi:hypothetical protein